MSSESPDFFVRLENHIAENTEHRQKVLEQLASGDWRMTMLEGHIKEIKETLTPVDAFMRSLKLISYICGGFLAVLLWIAAQKDADIKAMQLTLISHSQQIGEALSILRENQKDHDKDMARIERSIEAKR